MTDSPTTLPTHVGVFGGGRMGAGIAHTFLAAGCSVTVVEGDDSLALAARERVTSSLSKAAERGALIVQGKGQRKAQFAAGLYTALYAWQANTR